MQTHFTTLSLSFSLTLEPSMTKSNGIMKERKRRKGEDSCSGNHICGATAQRPAWSLPFHSYSTTVAKVQHCHYLTKRREQNRWVVQIYHVDVLLTKIIAQRKHEILDWFTVGTEMIILLHIFNLLQLRFYTIKLEGLNQNLNY